MNYPLRQILFLLAFSCFVIPSPALSQDANEATEPSVKGAGVIDLLKGGTLDAWKVPSARWQLKEGSIVGETGTERLSTPEWIYTKQSFSNFEFTWFRESCQESRTYFNRYHYLLIL